MKHSLKMMLIGIIDCIAVLINYSVKIVLIGLLVAICGWKTLQACAAPDFQFGSYSVDKNDSAAIYDLVNELKGIEFHFVFSNSLEDMIPNLKAVLEFRNQPVPEFLEGVRTHYRIMSIDEDLRLLKIECNDCETSRRLSYWDIEDGSVLIGTVEQGCGPICSYKIHFSIYRNGVKGKIDNGSVMGKISCPIFSLILRTHQKSWPKRPSNYPFG